MTDGRLRVYLGPAPGVGKTYAALSEVRELREAGIDAVVGTVDAHGRPDVAALVEGLEVIPPRLVEADGEPCPELSVEGVLARRPDVVLVDDLAHTNPSGSPRAKRWQDVRLLLEAGIDVIATLNVQHLESLQDVVRDITGVAQAEIIPDEVVRAADEIELVDLTQEGIRERLAAGRIYPPEEVDAALANFFRPGNLGALRELALFWTADRVDELVERYRLEHGIEEPWETRERVVVGVTGAVGGEDTIRRAGRMAMRSRGELVGVFVRTSDARPGEDAELDGQRELIKRLGGTYHEISGSAVGEALVEFARANNATQLVIGATRRSRWHELVRGSVVADILRRAGDLDVHVISGPAAAVRRYQPESRSPLPRRRRAWGWLAALAGFGLATAAMLQIREDIPLQNVLLVYLALSVVVAWIGGLRPALTSAVAGFMLGNYLFTPPYRTWSIASGEDVFALGVFVVVAGLVGLLVGSAARRAAEAAGRAAEAETLIGMIGAGRDGSAQRLVEALHLAIDSEGMALFGPDGGIVASTGEAPPDSVDGADRVVEVRDCRLAISAGHLHGADERLIAATAAQLEAVLDRADLAEEAAEAEALTRTDELRTALLRAVSHDLRSPLSAITASITSLLDPDIEWPSAARRAFLETIDGESRRLGGIVSDLLDAGRIQAGAIQVRSRASGLEGVVAAVTAAFRTERDRLVVEVDESLPAVDTDPALLERVIENLVRNALENSPEDTIVRLEAGVVGDRLDLRIIDRGPGLPPEMVERLFQPFSRLDDSHTAGVGLGLAVARGLTDALSHELRVEETPGGGTTMTISLKIAP